MNESTVVPVGTVSLTLEEISDIEAGAHYCEQHGVIYDPPTMPDGEKLCRYCMWEDEHAEDGWEWEWEAA